MREFKVGDKVRLRTKGELSSRDAYYALGQGWYRQSAGATWEVSGITPDCIRLKGNRYRWNAGWLMHADTLSPQVEAPKSRRLIRF